VLVRYTGMTTSRLMVFTSTSPVDVLVVWAWRVGDVVRVIGFRLVPSLIPPVLQVLKWSSRSYNFLRYLSSTLVFIDEFRLLATTGMPAEHMHELGLVMFDTSIPQQSPDNWQPFNLAPTNKNQHFMNSRIWEASVHTDSVRTQGGSSCNGPLVVDPTQSVVVLALDGRRTFSSREAALVIRTTALVGYMPSTHTCRHIHWNEWKRDVMVVKAPRNISYIRTFIVGSRVLLMARSLRDHRAHSRIHAYDFSRWGCRALVRVGSGKNERRLMPTPKKILFPQESNDKVSNMRSSGDSIVSCEVSNSLEP